MSRSSKKGPFVDPKLLQKVLKAKAQNSNEPIKTWSRACQIPPEFVNQKFLVHNGKIFKEVFVSETMVGHRLGEFSPTRMFRGHGQIVKRLLEKT
jgi:small subunit ribosomal protein S19